MSLIFTAFAIVIIVFVAIAIIKNSKKTNTYEYDNESEQSQSPIKPSYLLTNHEKTMFGEIRQAVPECLIFVQVALGAILWTKSYATRNKFNRLIADFVITDQNFNILAVIELDDKSHDNKQERDAQRDAMLREAGYKVLRYRYMPDKQKLRQDILG